MTNSTQAVKSERLTELFGVVENVILSAQIEKIGTLEWVRGMFQVSHLGLERMMRHCCRRSKEAKKINSCQF